VYPSKAFLVTLREEGWTFKRLCQNGIRAAGASSRNTNLGAIVAVFPFGFPEAFGSKLL